VLNFVLPPRISKLAFATASAAMIYTFVSSTSRVLGRKSPGPNNY